jgi:hypothetical protein
MGNKVAPTYVRGFEVIRGHLQGNDPESIIIDFEHSYNIFKYLNNCARCKECTFSSMASGSHKNLFISPWSVLYAVFNVKDSLIYTKMMRMSD